MHEPAHQPDEHRPDRPSRDALAQRVEQLEAAVARLRQENDRWREQAASQRRASELSQAYFRMSPDIVCMIDRESRITAINYTEAGLTMDDVVGRSVDDFTRPEELSKVRQVMEGALREGRTGEYETPYDAEDGDCIWYNVRVAPLREEGEIAGAILVMRNVTVRKELEERAEQERRWFEILAKASPSIVFQTDARGNAVFVNRRWEEITGRAEGSWQGLGWAAALHQDDREAVLESWRRAVALRSPWRYEFRLCHVRGDHKWVAALATPILDNDGRVSGFIGTCVDITELKQAQHQLQQIRSQLEERVTERTAELAASKEAYRQQVRILRSILDNLADGVVVANKQGKFLVFNPAARRMTGGAVIDGDPREWPRRYGLHLADGETLIESGQDPLSRAIRGERVRDAVVKIDNPGRRKPIWVSANASPLIDADGKIQGGTVVIRDITERKEAEQALRGEQQILRRLLDFQERERKLISHEIHDGFLQDVVGAKMMIDAFSAAVETGKQERTETLMQARHLLARAITEGRRMISELRPMVIDERGIIEAIEYLVADESVQPRLNIQFSHPRQLERLDPMLEGALFRIVQEALNNARRHSGCQQVTIRLERRASRLRLEIEDDGAGFRTEEIPESRFGLRGICERARLHGGEATIESKPGQGTRIVAEIPVDGSPF